MPATPPARVTGRAKSHGGGAFVPVSGDYDGDGVADIAVYEPVGAWSIVQSASGTIRVVGHGGGPNDVPLN